MKLLRNIFDYLYLKFFPLDYIFDKLKSSEFVLFSNYFLNRYVAIDITIQSIKIDFNNQLININYNFSIENGMYLHFDYICKFDQFFKEDNSYHAKANKILLTYYHEFIKNIVGDEIYTKDNLLWKSSAHHMAMSLANRAIFIDAFDKQFKEYIESKPFVQKKQEIKEYILNESFDILKNSGVSLKDVRNRMILE